MTHRITLITLGVADVNKSRVFYEQIFGWQASSASNDNIAFLKTPGMVLSLYPRDLLAEDATLSPIGKGFRAITLAQNVREKDEVGALIARAAEVGATIVKQAQDVFWGGHSGYFSDLDGHLWEIAWNPHFAWSPDGSLNLP